MKANLLVGFPNGSPRALRLLLTVWLAETASVWSQPTSDPIEAFWQTDDVVHTVVITNNVAYLGGEFSYVGPRNGAAGLADASTGNAMLDFPRLDGVVNTVVSDGAGGWFIGGRFVTAQHPTLTHLVHVRANRELDQHFKPSPNAAVKALALLGPDLWVGGDFSEVAGVTTGGLGLLNASTGTTNGLRLRVQGAVNAIVADGDTVYLGGEFTSIVTYRGNQAVSNSRARAAALSQSTGQILDWNPACTGGTGVNALAMGADTVYLGGDFTQCGGKPRNALASVNKLEGTVLNWNPNPQLTGSRAVIYALLLLEDVLYAGGNYSTIGARPRSCLAALQPSGFGQALASWQVDANAPVYGLASLGSDLLVLGSFTAIGGNLETTPNPATKRPGIARVIQPAGTVSDWGPQASMLAPEGAAAAYTAAAQGNALLLGGRFVSFGGWKRSRLAALTLTTGAATEWDPSADLTVRVLQLGRNGIYVGGNFTNVGGASRPRLAELDLTTGRATAWNPQFGTGQFVQAIAVAKDTVFAGGTFQRIGGQLRPNLAELDASTGALTEWNPQPNGAINALLWAENQLYVGGNFSTVSGSQHPFLALLTTNTGNASQLVKTFDAKLNGQVRSFAFAQDGLTLYVGGDFTRTGTQDRRAIIALDPVSGQEPTPWDAQITGTGVQQVRALLSVGQAVYVAGQFRGAGGDNRARVASVHAIFGAATSWDPGVDASVNAMTRNTHFIVIGGEFTRVGLHGASPDPDTAGQAMTYIAAFNALPKIEAVRPTTSGSYRFWITDGDGLGSSLLLQATSSLTLPAWTTVKTLEIQGLQDPVDDTPPPETPARYYRLQRP